MREVCKVGVLQQKDTTPKSFFAKKHVYLPEKVYVFCIHDDRLPFIELYGNEKEISAHCPQKLFDLWKCSYVICAVEDDRTFVIGFDDDKRNPLELTALSNQERQEWVSMLTCKLIRLDCLPPPTNEYGPLPYQLMHCQYNNGLNSADSDDEGVAGLSESLERNLINGSSVASTVTDSGPFYERFFAPPRTAVVNNNEQQQLYESISRLSARSVSTDVQGSVAASSSGTEPITSDESTVQANPLSRQKSLPPLLPRRPVKSVPVTSDSNEADGSHYYAKVPVSRYSDTESEYKTLPPGSPRKSSPLPSLITLLSNNPSTSITRPQSSNTTEENHYENFTLLSCANKAVSSSSEAVDYSRYKALEGRPKPVIKENGCRKHLPVQSNHSNNKEPVSLTPVEENSPITLVENQDIVDEDNDDRVEVPMAPLSPPPVPPRNEAPINGFFPRRLMKVKANEVLKLKSEIDSEYGVKVCVSMEAAIKGLALVEFKGNIWVAGWHVHYNSVLSPGFHVGDKLMAIDNRPIPNSLENTRRLLSVLAFAGPIEIIVKRLPYGKTFLLERNVEGENLGFVRKKGKNEIIDIEPNSSASKADFPLKAVSFLNPGAAVNWFITEINGRPLNFFSKNNEAGQRLAAIGLETSVVVQPVDFVKSLKKTLKHQKKNYKEYVLG